MLRLFDDYAHLFQSWRVLRYEQEGEAYMLYVSAVLTDGSRLEMRDYLFVDGKRKYAYQWLETDGSLRQRWECPALVGYRYISSSHPSTKRRKTPSVDRHEP